MKFENVIKLMRSEGVIFQEGLTDDEIRIAETIYEVKFPIDLKEFLKLGLPVSEGFYNWRDISEENIKLISDRFKWILDGFLFDIEHNDFWYPEWGDKPDDLKLALDLCKKELKKSPKMIPIYSHRFIPSEPREKGNPVFSIYQTDIIYYGENLEEYFKLEFNQKEYSQINWESIKEVRFWSDLQS